MSLNNEDQLKLFCKLCNKIYASQSSLCNHNKKFHNNKEGNNMDSDVVDNIDVVDNVDISTVASTKVYNVDYNNKIIKCEYCNKIFATRFSKSTHKKKSCKFKDNNIIETNTNTNNNNELVELKNTISELKNLILQNSKTLLKNNNVVIGDNNSLDIKNTNKIIFHNSNNNIIDSNINNEFINFTQNLITFNDKPIKFFYYNDQVYFKAKDITKVLEYKNTNDVIIDNIDIEYNIDNEDKFEINEILGWSVEMPVLPYSFIDTIKNEDLKTIFINESGLYSLILISKNPEAKLFKKWIISEVLPYIRKYGSYSIINNYVEVDLDKYYGIDCVYVIHIKDDIYKYGNTSHLFKRLQTHKTNFNYKKIIKIYEMKNINDAIKLEKKIMKLTKSLNINIIYNLGNTNHKEMFEINNKDLDNIIKKIDNFTLNINNDVLDNNNKVLDNNNQLKIEEIKNETIKIENENLKLKLELLKLELK
jgi:prophage antirepressor-like protein